MLQKVPISAAAVVGPRAILTNLVTDSPNLTVIIVDTGAAVICNNKTIRAVTGATFRRWMANVFTAQSGASFQTAGLASRRVSLVGSFRTVRFAIAHFVHRNAHGRARTSPLSRVTVSRVTVTSFLIAVVSTVVEVVTHPSLRDASATGARKLIALAALILTALFVTVVPTVIPMVTDEGLWDAVAISALKLVRGTVWVSAVSLVGAVPAVLEAVAVLRVIVTGAICTSLFGTRWVVAVVLV